MKKTLSTLLATTLLVASIGSAHADRGWEGRRGYAYDGPRYEHQHRHRSWVGPAAVLAITGAALGATIYHQTHTPPPPIVYSAPPPNPNIWYYCGSAGQYYPYAQFCPEGWQAVPAR